MTTVVCSLFKSVNATAPYAEGLYTPEWADKLYRGCRRHLTGDLRFVCVTDFEQGEFAEPVEAHPFIYPEHVGRWMCLNECLRPDLELGHALFLGLDTVITGSLDGIASYDGHFAMIHQPRNLTPACNGVVSFSQGWGDETWGRYIQDPRKWESGCKAEWSRGFGSEMVYWRDHCGPYDYLDDLNPKTIYSWNVHLKSKPDEYLEALNPSIVYFHGGIKPHNAGREWVSQHWL